MTECQRFDLNEQQGRDRQDNAADRLRAEAVQQFATWAQSNFDNLDTDGNGFVSRADFQKNGQLAANPFGRVLHDEINRIQSLSNDERFFDNNGVTRADLQKLSQYAGQMPGELAMARNIKETLARHFKPTLAAGGLTEGELEYAAASGKYTGCDLEAIRQADDRYRDIGRMVSKTARRIRDWHLDSYINDVKTRYGLVSDISKQLGK
jgi:hypothetical protein